MVSKRIKNLSAIQSPYRGEPYADLIERMTDPGRISNQSNNVGQGIEDRNVSPPNSESGLFEDPKNMSAEVPPQMANRSAYVASVDPTANDKSRGSKNPYIGLVVTPVNTSTGLPTDGIGVDGHYDMFPFYFSDFRRPDRIIRFPATLTSLVENYDVEWNADTYYGRVQRVPIYRGTNRSLDVGFKLVAVDDGTMSGIDQVNMLYQKLEAFIWLIYPSFKEEKVRNAAAFEKQLEEDTKFQVAKETKLHGEVLLDQISSAEEITTSDGKPGLRLKQSSVTNNYPNSFIPSHASWGEAGEEIQDPRTTPGGKKTIAWLEALVEAVGELAAGRRQSVADNLEEIATKAMVIHKAPLIRMRIGNMIKRPGNTAGARDRRGLGKDSLGVSLHDSQLRRDDGLAGYITNINIDYNLGTNEQKMQILYDPREQNEKANFVSYHINVDFNFEVVHDETPYGWDPAGEEDGDTSGMLFYTRWKDYEKLDKVT